MYYHVPVSSEDGNGKLRIVWELFSQPNIIFVLILFSCTRNLEQLSNRIISFGTFGTLEFHLTTNNLKSISGYRNFKRNRRSYSFQKTSEGSKNPLKDFRTPSRKHGSHEEVLFTHGGYIWTSKEFSVNLENLKEFFLLVILVPCQKSVLERGNSQSTFSIFQVIQKRFELSKCILMVLQTHSYNTDSDRTSFQ